MGILGNEGANEDVGTLRVEEFPQEVYVGPQGHLSRET